ncbi:hypothetical protein EGW08_022711, partial [Elysia chlorotica]
MSNNNNNSSSSKKSESETVPQQQEPAEEQAGTVLSKFESVWKFVFNVRNQLNQIFSSGETGHHLDEALKMLKTINTLVLELYNVFDRCLAMSPLVVHNNAAEFEKLCSALNSFLSMSGVVDIDSGTPVRPESMMAYFKQTKN